MAKIDWENVARNINHPLRLRIMERPAADPQARFSPPELAAKLGERIGNVSYHVRKLHADGLLVKAGSAQRRGAAEHYYRAGAKLLP